MSFIGIGVLLLVAGLGASSVFHPATQYVSSSNNYYATTSTTSYYRSSPSSSSYSNSPTTATVPPTTRPTGNGALVFQQNVSGTCYSSGQYVMILGNNQATTYDASTGSSLSTLTASTFGSSANKYGEDAQSVAGGDVDGKPVIVVSAVNRQSGTGINADTVNYTVTAYDGTSGSKRWQGDALMGTAVLTPGSSGNQPRFKPEAVLGGVVVGSLQTRNSNGDSQNELIGLNLADGSQAWRIQVDPSDSHPYAFGLDTIFARNTSHAPMLIDAASGAPTPLAFPSDRYGNWWLYQLDHDTYIGEVNSKLIGVHRDGSVSWQYPNDITGDVYTDPVSGVVLFRDGSSNSIGLLAYDAKAGTQLWGMTSAQINDVSFSLKDANNGYAVASTSHTNSSQTVVLDDRTGAQLMVSQDSIDSSGRWVNNNLYVSCGGKNNSGSAVAFIANKLPVGIDYSSSSSSSNGPSLVLAPTSSSSSGTTAPAAVPSTVAAPTASAAPASFHVHSPGCGGTCKLYRRSEPNSGSPDHGYHIDGDAVTVVCQTSGEQINDPDSGNSNVWDKLDSGYYVSDVFLDTPKPGPSPTLPTC